MMHRNRSWWLPLVFILLAFASQPVRSQRQDATAPGGAE
jgi:hypothetical protein